MFPANAPSETKPHGCLVYLPEFFFECPISWYRRRATRAARLLVEAEATCSLMKHQQTGPNIRCLDNDNSPRAHIQSAGHQKASRWLRKGALRAEALSRFLCGWMRILAVLFGSVFVNTRNIGRSRPEGSGRCFCESCLFHGRDGLGHRVIAYYLTAKQKKKKPS